MIKKFNTILITGGAGYVGSMLVPALLSEGYAVKVLDLYLYGENVLAAVKNNPNLQQIKGDIRDLNLLKDAVTGIDAVIHLACISNDPSFELDPQLGKSINYDAFLNLVIIAKRAGVKRFIYASSSSVYGLKNEENVTEDLPLSPLTDYSKYKALCEDVLFKETTGDFVTIALRPATVCGYSPRQRLDLTVNILTNMAVNRGEITVFGGEQKRPNVHIKDMARAYSHVLKMDDSAVSGKIFNVGYENYKVKDIASMVKGVVGDRVEIKFSSTDDMRSYHISSEKITRELGFRMQHSVKEAIGDLVNAFKDNRIPNPLEDIRYYNIKTMRAKKLEWNG